MVIKFCSIIELELAPKQSEYMQLRVVTLAIILKTTLICWGN